MKKNEEVIAVVGQSAVDSKEAELSKAAIEAKTIANDLKIESDEQYEQAAAFGSELRRRSANVTEFFKPLKDAAHKSHKAVCDRERDMLKPIKDAETILKKAMGAYQEKKRQEAIAEQNRLAEIARKEQEALMAAAIQAEEKGDTAAAEEHFENAQFVEVAASRAPVVQAPVKARGSSVRTAFEIESIDLSKVPVVFEGQIIRPVDMNAVMRIIRATNGKVAIPGIKFKEVQAISFRK